MTAVNRIPFGVTPGGAPVEEITLTAGELSCRIITYGGAIRALTVPDRAGRPVDVVLGFDTLEDYLNHDKCLGALIGRYANRIGGSRFQLNGREYTLPANDGVNHLHGGRGFDKQVWKVEGAWENSLTLSLVSPDGQEGYPGALSAQVTYTLGAEGLTLDYRAVCDQDTLCSLTNHAYFNLSGHGSGDILDHRVRLFAQRYTPADGGSIPTGELAPVEGTPMDLRQPTRVGDHIDDSFPQLTQAGGYDHNWVVDGQPGVLRPVGTVYTPDTGIRLEVDSTLPGVQFYSGNYLGGCPAGKGGAPYGRRWGLCLETQHFPDAPNKPQFPSPVLRAGEKYHQVTRYRFSAE